MSSESAYDPYSSGYGYGGWVTGQRQYSTSQTYQQSAQQRALYGPPAHTQDHQTVAYMYQADRGFDLHQAPHQHSPISTFNQGLWGPGYTFPTRRFSDVPSIKPALAAPFIPSSAILSGPPQRPRRSGHALWVGNLHPTTSIVALKEHFSQQATSDIESVFLIARSTCAFVNYRSEQACKYALARFHSSSLNGNNLVCRIRRDSGISSSSTPSTPTSPTMINSFSSDRRGSSGSATAKEPSSPLIVGLPIVVAAAASTAALSSPVSSNPQPAKIPEKFFILKSLTIQDLEASVRKGTWVTQPHNEAALNEAFQDAETVYLVFSANRSREYFGFAKMTSVISPDSEQLSISRSEEPEELIKSKHLKYTDTPATDSAPKGRIVDDSARGTLFWEADSTDAENADKSADENSPLSAQERNEQSMGKVFGVEWLNINKVPFFRTRGLRNPWNANREVKIARDGTEIEPRVGRRLLTLFAKPTEYGQM